MITVNYGKNPLLWDDVKKQRLIHATIECAKAICKSIKEGAFKKSNTPNLQIFCYYVNNGRNRDFLHVTLCGCTIEQAKFIVYLHNTWKPDSPLWKTMIDSFFTTEQIMLNVDVANGDFCDIYARKVIHLQ